MTQFWSVSSRKDQCTVAVRHRLRSLLGGATWRCSAYPKRQPGPGLAIITSLIPPPPPGGTEILCLSVFLSVRPHISIIVMGKSKS